MIDHLPVSNPPMLVSVINTLLRDREFESLEDICSYYDVPVRDIEFALAQINMKYNEQLNKIL